MKVLVIYDSTYGNTEKIAKAIGEAISGDVKVLRAIEVNLSVLEFVNLLIVGSPTQGGRPTVPIQDFLKHLPATIQGIDVAAFDTRLTTKFVGIFGYAAGRIASKLKEKGGNLVAPPAAFFVTGSTPSLKDGELDRAVTWARSLMKQ